MARSLAYEDVIELLHKIPKLGTLLVFTGDPRTSKAYLCHPGSLEDFSAYVQSAEIVVDAPSGVGVRYTLLYVTTEGRPARLITETLPAQCTFDGGECRLLTEPDDKPNEKLSEGE